MYIFGRRYNFRMGEELNFEYGEEETGDLIALALLDYESYGFNRDLCTEIALMPFPQAFERAFAMLVKAGLNPREVLAPFIIDTD
jgi:hypothetical protein